MRSLIGLILVSGMVLPAMADHLVAESPVFMWRAEKDGATIHLLGSVHAGRSDWYPLDSRIEAALAAADTVACELNMSDPSIAMKAAIQAQQQGMYAADESLRDHVSAAAWEQVTSRLASQVPAAVLERMRPGLVAVTLIQTMLVEAGLDVTQGVDLYILEAAKAAAKPVVALETVEQQVALLFGPDAVIDALILEEALAADGEEMLALFARMTTAWQSGDAKAMDALYREEWGDDPRLTEFHENMVVTRNQRMADKLAKCHGRWFAVVGALHLSGDEGVPALLADAGWKVTQVGLAAVPVH